MKSEKAREAIERYRSTFSAPYEAAETAEYCRLFREVAELAEQEAEERMRDKAVKAFKFACTDNYGGECWANDDHHVKCGGQCVKMNDFIQKLNEE